MAHCLSTLLITRRHPLYPRGHDIHLCSSKLMPSNKFFKISKFHKLLPIQRHRRIVAMHSHTTITLTERGILLSNKSSNVRETHPDHPQPTQLLQTVKASFTHAPP